MTGRQNHLSASGSPREGIHAAEAMQTVDPAPLEAVAVAVAEARMRPADCMTFGVKRKRAMMVARGIEMRRAALVLALSTAGMTACATVNGNIGRGERPEDRLTRGLRALQTQDFVMARNVLDSLYMEQWSKPVGQHAALALVAAEVDTRNTDRQLWRAADISARLLNIPKLDRWMVPVAESYYNLALELGAQEQRLAERKADERTIPQASRESVPAQMNRLTTQRDEAKKQAEQLQQQLAAKDKELRETKQELERIKRTIKS